MITATEDILGEAIASRLLEIQGLSDFQREELLEVWVAISDEIIRHFVENALITVDTDSGQGEIL